MTCKILALNSLLQNMDLFTFGLYELLQGHDEFAPGRATPLQGKIGIRSDFSPFTARTPHALEVDALNVPILRDMGLGLRVFEDIISNALSRRLQAKDAAKIRGKGQQTQCEERQHGQTQSVKRCTELSDFSPLAAAHNGGLLLKRPLLQHSTLDRLELQDCVERISRRLAESRRRREITDVEASTDKKPNPSPRGLYLGACIPIAPGGTGVAQTMLAAPLLTQIEERLRADFPSTMIQGMMDDMENICKTTKVLVDGQCNALELKLELMGEDSCHMWHCDYFVGRSIVTYCGLGGTTFCDDPVRSLDSVREVGAGSSVESAEVNEP